MYNPYIVTLKRTLYHVRYTDGTQDCSLTKKDCKSDGKTIESITTATAKYQANFIDLLPFLKRL